MSIAEFNESLLNLETYLRHFALGFTRNEEDAKDLTQETMLKAITYSAQYKPQTNFKAWVFTIMRNIFINQYRRKVKSGTIFDRSGESYLLAQATGNTDTPLNFVTGRELNKQIRTLGDEFRAPFEMHFEGFKYKEIADKLGIPIGTVKSRIFIARKKLMDLLPDYQFRTN